MRNHRGRLTSSQLIPFLLIFIASPYFASQSAKVEPGGGWSLIHSAAPGVLHAPEVSAIYFIDKLRGWSLAGTLLKTEDGGKTWSAKLLKADSVKTDFYFTDGLQGWVVGGQLTGGAPGNRYFAPLILKTRDGGETWAEQEVILPNDLYPRTDVVVQQVTMCNATSGWAISENIVFRTLNGGQVWEPRYFDTASQLRGVACAGENAGIVVGDKGLILKTRNGSADWQEEYYHPALNFAAIRVFGSDVWVAGQKGHLMNSTLSGGGWVVHPLGTAETIHDIYFRGDSGWAVGASGTVMQTRDAGKTWSKQTIPTERDLHSVYFLDPSVGWVGGQGQLVFQYTSKGSALVIH